MSFEKVVLNLGERSYAINIGAGLIERPEMFSSFCEGEKVLVLSNRIVAPFYLEKVSKQLLNKTVYQFILEDGEIHKSLDSYSAILDFLMQNQFRRNDTLIALGGGVIGDLGGFVAASYQRGMNFIQMPTTLLAQVDSSVGGKTAVNHRLGKNMIGAFYQPKSVIIDTDTLKSLPEREFLSGLAEVIKYALLGEAELMTLLIEKREHILARNDAALTRVISLSCRKKAAIVAEDEQEKGSRALLNLGHTFGHAIEKITQYKQYLHGEAIAIGMHMAIQLSVSKSLLSPHQAEKFHALLDDYKLNKFISSSISIPAMLESMKLDKKNLSSKYRFVLPRESGCVIIEEDNIELISQAISKFIR